MMMCNWLCVPAGRPAVTQQSASVLCPACPSVSEPRYPSADQPHLYSPPQRTKTNPCCPAGQRQARIRCNEITLSTSFKKSDDWCKKVSDTGVVAPVLSCILASVRVMSASVAEVNHLKPCSLKEPSVWGTATVSVPLAEETQDKERQLLMHYTS